MCVIQLWPVVVSVERRGYFGLSETTSTPGWSCPHEQNVHKHPTDPHTLTHQWDFKAVALQ